MNIAVLVHIVVESQDKDEPEIGSKPDIQVALKNAGNNTVIGLEEG
jgi:hypothetical protein